MRELRVVDQGLVVPINYRRTIAGFKCRPVNVRSDNEPVTDMEWQAIEVVECLLGGGVGSGLYSIGVILFPDGLVGFMEKFEELCGRLVMGMVRREAVFA